MIMGKYMEILHATMDQTRVSFCQWPYLSPENREQIVELREQYERVFERVICDGIAAKEFPEVMHPRVTVLATMGLLNSAMRWYSPIGPESPQEVGDDLADYCLGGLCHPSGTPSAASEPAAES